MSATNCTKTPRRDPEAGTRRCSGVQPAAGYGSLVYHPIRIYLSFASYSKVVAGPNKDNSLSLHLLSPRENLHAIHLLQCTPRRPTRAAVLVLVHLSTSSSPTLTWPPSWEKYGFHVHQPGGGQKNKQKKQPVRWAPSIAPPATLPPRSTG